ncbi:hypothetical protein [Flavisolibacter ginsenosidimutans]|uniref:Uncharacterized protein n=1 Tax=Flavisolibacter ginsenosidimutans TaxID=661481 RepID=A0A5B8UPR6_9BACT|nr:hypothetical protein [Flavisolibacter ginsenosidimutans]QEC58040.1 hypothetical protein FSB75_19725 [Flavisolibacter ginsenosidimutans]
MANNSSFNQNRPAHNAHPAQTGNASNPSPQAAETVNVDEQLLPKQAEKYLREAGNIEDEPDAQDEEDMDEEISRQHDDDE